MSKESLKESVFFCKTFFFYPVLGAFQVSKRTKWSLKEQTGDILVLYL